MIVNDSEAIKRLNSPMNLINRLKSASSSRKDAMSLFGVGKRKEERTAPLPRIEKEETRISFNPFLASPPKESSQPVLNDILENHESQIRLGLAHDKALELLNRSVEMLSTKLDDIKADKLPAVVSAASKTVESIRKERIANRANGNEQEVHYHFYTPEQKTIKDYEVIDVA